MPDTTQSLRPHTLTDRVASWFRRAATTFIPGWDLLKSDIGVFDVDQSWARLEAQIRRLGLDEAHGDVIDRLVEAEHKQLVEHATLQHLSRTKALNRITSQGQWHYTRLQGKVHQLRSLRAQHEQQAQEAWLALTGQEQPTAAESVAAAITPAPIPNWHAEATPHEAPDTSETSTPITTDLWDTNSLYTEHAAERHAPLNHHALKE